MMIFKQPASQIAVGDYVICRFSNRVLGMRVYSLERLPHHVLLIGLTEGGVKTWKLPKSKRVEIQPPETADKTPGASLPKPKQFRGLSID